MKKFMLIFLGTEYTELGLSPEEMQTQMGKWFAWQGKMEAAGVVETGHALESSNIRRVSGPERTVTDLTAAEVKEIVGGYYIVKAADFDAAAKIAEDYPDYHLGGTVEIREVMVFEQ